MSISCCFQRYTCFKSIYLQLCADKISINVYIIVTVVMST